MTDPGDRDDALAPADRARLRAHFAAAEPTDAPAFRTTLAAARARSRTSPTQGAARHWAHGSLAAAAAVAALVAGRLLAPAPAPPGVVPDTDLLLAELTTTTRWRAPSDRWLHGPDLPAAGIPELDHWTYEVKTWP